MGSKANKVGNKSANKGPLCYFANFGTCTCGSSDFCDETCPGTCESFISEADYFQKLMDGSIKETQVRAEDPKVREDRLHKKLALGKTKKQLKYEARAEAERKGEVPGSGYSLMDDPRFKDLFS